jgi:xanthine dehydrogenase iron-sulfur cluster and FAD-binding subunit A
MKRRKRLLLKGTRTPHALRAIIFRIHYSDNLPKCKGYRPVMRAALVGVQVGWT